MKPFSLSLINIQALNKPVSFIHFRVSILIFDFLGKEPWSRLNWICFSLIFWYIIPILIPQLTDHCIMSHTNLPENHVAIISQRFYPCSLCKEIHPPAPPSGAEEKPGREVVIQHCINVIMGLDNSRQTKNLKKRTKLWCFRNNPTDPTAIFILHVRAVMPFLKVGKRLGIFPCVRESIYPAIRAPLIFSNICRIRNIVASFVQQIVFLFCITPLVVSKKFTFHVAMEATPVVIDFNTLVT